MILWQTAPAVLSVNMTHNPQTHNPHTYNCQMQSLCKPWDGHTIERAFLYVPARWQEMLCVCEENLCTCCSEDIVSEFDLRLSVFHQMDTPLHKSYVHYQDQAMVPSEREKNPLCIQNSCRSDLMQSPHKKQKTPIWSRKQSNSAKFMQTQVLCICSWSGRDFPSTMMCGQKILDSGPKIDMSCLLQLQICFTCVLWAQGSLLVWEKIRDSNQTYISCMHTHLPFALIPLEVRESKTWDACVAARDIETKSWWTLTHNYV